MCNWKWKCFRHERSGYKHSGEIDGRHIFVIFKDDASINFYASRGYIPKIGGYVTVTENIKVLLTLAGTYRICIFLGAASSVLRGSAESKPAKSSTEIRLIIHSRDLEHSLVTFISQYPVQMILSEPYKLICEFKYNVEISRAEIYNSEPVINSVSKSYSIKIKPT